jgi:hypothetical protein
VFCSRFFQNEVTRLRNLANRAAAPAEDAAGEEGGEVVPAEPVSAPEEAAPTISTVLPDNAALAPLRALLYETLTRSLSPELLVSTVAPGPAAGNASSRGGLQREMAYDAALWNFPFPEVVSFEMLV